MSCLINLRFKFQKCFFFVTFLPNPSVDNTSAPAPDFLSPSPSMLTRITQPVCADLLEGLPGGGVWDWVWGRHGRSGKDLRETPPLDLRRRGDLQPIGKPANCVRGRDNERCFGTEDVSDPDDTPEDVEDEEEPEFCGATSRAVRRWTLFNMTRRRQGELSR